MPRSFGTVQGNFHEDGPSGDRLSRPVHSPPKPERGSAPKGAGRPFPDYGTGRLNDRSAWNITRSERREMDAIPTARPSLGRQSWNFARHFLEMCIAMCAGGAILSLIVFGMPALIGAPNLREQFPELGLIVIAILLIVPMAAWMLFRGMEWRPIVEMSAIPVGLAILMISAVWAGFAPGSTMQIGFGSFCGMSCVGMFVVMFFRLDLYTGRTGHHMSRGAHAAHAAHAG
jgi:hypothetical protein